MSQLQIQLPTDKWIYTSWEDYKQVADSLQEKEKTYYYKGYMRLEILPVSYEHGKDHATIISVVNLFIALKGIPATGLDTITFRKPGIWDCQPDVAYYLQDRAQAIPTGTGIVNLDRYPAPNLVIEIAETSLLDDLGVKRSLYEELGVDEYWVIDVQNTQISAYVMADGGSKPIQESQVLSGLTILILESALRRSREMSQSEVCAWLLSQFQQKRDI